jgi:hypothetical protein
MKAFNQKMRSRNKLERMLRIQIGSEEAKEM